MIIQFILSLIILSILMVPIIATISRLIKNQNPNLNKKETAENETKTKPERKVISLLKTDYDIPVKINMPARRKIDLRKPDYDHTSKRKEKYIMPANSEFPYVLESDLETIAQTYGGIDYSDISALEHNWSSLSDVMRERVKKLNADIRYACSGEDMDLYELAEESPELKAIIDELVSFIKSVSGR